MAGCSSCWCDHGLPSSLSRAGAPAPETGQLAVSMTYLFLLVFHVTFLKKQTTIVSQYNCLSVFFISLFVK